MIRRKIQELGADPNFLLLCFITFVDASGVGALYPLLAKIQTAHHLSVSALGLMAGANFLAALVVQVTISRYLDGRARHVLLLAAVLVGAAAFAWFARAGDEWQLVAARGVGGIAYGIIGPASLSEASVGVSGERKGARLGAITSSLMLGITLGPLAGSALYAAGGLALPFEVTALGLVASAVALVVLRKPHQAAAAEQPRANPRIHRPVNRRAVLSVIFLGVAAQFPMGIYDALWSRMLTDKGADSLFIGLTLTLFGVPYIFMAPWGGRLSERRGPLLTTAVCLAVANVFFALYGIIPWPLVIGLLGIGEACFQAVAVPGAYSTVARVWPDEMAARGQGVVSAAGTAAAGITAVIAAPLYASTGAGATFSGSAVLSMLLLGISLAIGMSVPALRNGSERFSGHAHPSTRTDLLPEPPA